MSYKISILGSTGSIGTSTLKIIEKKRKYFNIQTLVANSNYKKIVNQIIKFKPKIFIILDNSIYLRVKKKFKKSKIKIYNNYQHIKLKKKINDVTVCAVPGIDGLEPTILFLKTSKKKIRIYNLYKNL